MILWKVYKFESNVNFWQKIKLGYILYCGTKHCLGKHGDLLFKSSPDFLYIVKIKSNTGGEKDNSSSCMPTRMCILHLTMQWGDHKKGTNYCNNQIWGKQLK